MTGLPNVNCPFELRCPEVTLVTEKCDAIKSRSLIGLRPALGSPYSYPSHFRPDGLTRYDAFALMFGEGNETTLQ